MTTLVNKTTKDIPPLVKIQDVANHLSVCRNTVRRLIDSGDLTASVINPHTTARVHYRVTRDSLLDFYQKRFGHSLLRALNHAHES